jgi:putative polyketide hydroxylase
MMIVSHEEDFCQYASALGGTRIEERNPMMAQEHIPVLIVGAGGAGLSLSLLLRQQGIPSVLIERRPDISWYPCARNLNFRTLEVFRGLRLEAEVIAAGTHFWRVFRKETLASPA